MSYPFDQFAAVAGANRQLNHNGIGVELFFHLGHNAARIGAGCPLPTVLASGSGCGRVALTTTSLRTGAVCAAAFCQTAVDEKATAIAAARG